MIHYSHKREYDSCDRVDSMTRDHANGNSRELSLACACCASRRFCGWCGGDLCHHAKLSCNDPADLPILNNTMRYSLTTMCALLAVCSLEATGAIDGNGNGQSDVWEMIYGAPGLAGGVDTDGDGFTNAQESVAGTDPRQALDHPLLEMSGAGAGFRFSWHGVAGKRYTLLGNTDLTAPWAGAAPACTGEGGPTEQTLAATAFSRRFFKLNITDIDTDADGVTDAEERMVGFDARSASTGRRSEADLTRITTGLTAANYITVSSYDDFANERWPDPVVFVIRRTGGLQPLTVSFSLTGSASRGTDYTVLQPGNTVRFAPGQREIFIEAVPVADADDSEATETIILTALAGSGYTVGAASSAAASLLNETASSLPGAKAAARLLIQAGFGPDQDADTDADQIPENVEEVMASGIAPWIENQFTRPVGRLQPMVEWCAENTGALEIYGDWKQHAWWGRAMGLPRLRPDAPTTQLADPLRQRMGLALSEIFVISDRMEDLAVSPVGMVNYYDMLLGHAFGNYRDLLRDVSLHPCMGLYLSHLGNRRPNPAANVFPDENYAREIMQLFSIGLWQLHPDGTRMLDPQGQPVPSYDNNTITQMARVFTGLAFGGTNVNFGLWPRDFTTPMKGWDAEHDLAPKQLPGGTVLPARSASPGNTGTATMADVNGAVDALTNHPNTGPFFCRALIQRLITSNPSPAYVGRVSAAFRNNGQGVAGDMKAVIRALLLDSEARDPAMLSVPTYGRLREPFLRCVNLARAFNAVSQEGWYYLDSFPLDHAQQPLNSPSVFNFFLPSYSPPGTLSTMGLVAPEMQIVNASTATTAPNYFWNAITDGLHRWGTGRPARETRLNLTQEMLMNVPPAAVNDPYPSVQALDPDPLIRRLDLALTGGTMAPEQCRIIREAMMRLGPNTVWEWPKTRLKLGIYLMVTGPDFSIQR